jgi:hypothetical protein
LLQQGKALMTDAQPELDDDTFYVPLFALITSKLQATGGIDLERFLVELFPQVPARFDGDDLYEAIMRLATRGIIRCEESDEAEFIALVE